MAEPRATRPGIQGYGIVDADSGKGLYPWGWAAERLLNAHTYWVATTRPDGRPHIMPVWGIWLEGAFYFSTGRQSRKARNLAANPACVVTLEINGESVIVEGVASEVRDPGLLGRLAKAYTAKYEWDMEGNEEPFFVVRPRVAFGFNENDSQFTSTATRWIFDGD